MMTFARSQIKEKAFLLCKVLISANGFPIFMIAFINIVVLMTMLGHGKYQYLFCREIQGKIICPHECPLKWLTEGVVWRFTWRKLNLGRKVTFGFWQAADIDL